MRALPPRAVELRAAAVEDDARNEEAARPRIEAHIAACRMVADAPAQTFHAQISDTRDLQLDGYSRPAAIWLVAGRSLGMLHAFIVQIAAGVCTEALVTARAMHEANRLLFIFSQREGEELLRVWLDDEGRFDYVKPGQARTAQSTFEEMLNSVLEGKGLPGDPRVQRSERAHVRHAQPHRAQPPLVVPRHRLAARPGRWPTATTPAPCAAPRTRRGPPR